MLAFRPVMLLGGRYFKGNPPLPLRALPLFLPDPRPKPLLPALSCGMVEPIPPETGRPGTMAARSRRKLPECAMLNGYDIIGDIHGCADKLEALLARLGYLKQDGVWKHADRIAVFLGDYIDRGPEILETLKIVRDMRAAGAAVALMGNHEFNAVCWNTPDPAHPGQHLRPHTEKNRLQHEASLDQLAGCYQMWIGWMRTLPLWLELGDLGGHGGRLHLAHACWSPDAIEVLKQAERCGEAMIEGRHDAPTLSDKGYEYAGRDSFSIEYHAIETVLKGPEVPLPEGVTFCDKDGVERDSIRVKWWLGPGRSCREMSLMGTDCTEALPENARVEPEDWQAIAVDCPTFFGHYWLGAEEAVKSFGPKVACLDFSAVKGGPLVAYRWNRGDTEIKDENFVWIDKPFTAERKIFFP